MMHSLQRLGRVIVDLPAVGVLAQAVRNYVLHQSANQAGSLAFSAVLAMFPLLLLLSAAAGFMGQPGDAAALAERVGWLHDGLNGIPGVRLHSPQDPARRAGIVSFSIDGVANAEVHRRLQEQQVICIPRGAGVRFSPHFYTERRTIDETVAIVRKIAER